MLTWNWEPSDLYVETLTAPVIVSAVSPQEVFVGRVTDQAVRSFRLRHSIVTTAEANSMAAVFTAVRGALLPLVFVDPNTSRPYLVRFDSALRLEMFDPRYLRTAEIKFVVVTS